MQSAYITVAMDEIRSRLMDYNVRPEQYRLNYSESSVPGPFVAYTNRLIEVAVQGQVLKLSADLAASSPEVAAQEILIWMGK